VERSKGLWRRDCLDQPNSHADTTSSNPSHTYSSVTINNYPHIPYNVHLSPSTSSNTILGLTAPCLY
jgi:hypothetical protein